MRQVCEQVLFFGLPWYRGSIRRAWCSGRLALHPVEGGAEVIPVPLPGSFRSAGQGVLQPSVSRHYASTRPERRAGLRAERNQARASPSSPRAARALRRLERAAVGTVVVLRKGVCSRRNWRNGLGRGGAPGCGRHRRARAGAQPGRSSSAGAACCCGACAGRRVGRACAGGCAEGLRRRRLRNRRSAHVGPDRALQSRLHWDGEPGGGGCVTCVVGYLVVCGSYAARPRFQCPQHQRTE